MIVRYSSAARSQLTEIWRFSRRRWGEGRADKYVSALYAMVRHVAEGGKRARDRSDIHAGLSVVRSGSHNIFLTLDAEASVLHVVAILHQRMEPSRRIRKALKGE